MSPNASPNDKNEDDKVSMISNHEEAERMSILKLIQIVRDNIPDLKLSFDQFSKKNSSGKGFMNVHDFNSFLSVLLELKLKSNNKKSLFNIMDMNKDGYCKEKDFMKILSLSQADIDAAILKPEQFMNGLILDLVVEQLYHEIVYFKQEGIFELQAKLDKKGNIALPKLEKQLSYSRIKLTNEEKQIFENISIVDEFTNEKFVPFKRIIEKSISKANIKIDFKVSYMKMGTFGSNSFKKEDRFKEMEKHYEEEAKRKAEEEERKRQQTIEDDGDFSQFESSEDLEALKSGNKSKFPFSISKDAKLIKSKFGKKFLDVFQKSLLETISKNRNNGENPLFYPFSAKSNLAGEVPQLLVNNYQNYKSIYKLNKHSSNQEFVQIDSLGYQTLQGNINFYRKDILKGSPRRNINNLGLPQKIWSSGRPRGSLERFNGQPKTKNLYVEPQGLYSGIQGISIQPHQRDYKTLDVINNQEKRK